MATANNTTGLINNNLQSMNVQLTLELAQKAKKDSENAQALLLNMTQTLASVLEQVGGESGSSNSASAPAPTAGAMQEAMGRLMGLLAELQGQVADWNNQKAHFNNSINQSLLVEMQARVKDAQTKLTQISNQEDAESHMSLFQKILTGILGVIAAGLACCAGNPVLGALILSFTIAQLTPAMDALNTALQNAGWSPVAITAFTVSLNIAINATLIVASGGADAAAAASTLGRAVQVMQGLMVAGSALQIEGSVIEGDIQLTLANLTEGLGESNAALTVIQGLLNMNTSLMTADIKSEKGQMQSRAERLATLGGDLSKGGAAVAQVLA